MKCSNCGKDENFAGPHGLKWHPNLGKVLCFECESSDAQGAILEDEKLRTALGNAYIISLGEYLHDRAHAGTNS